MNISSQVLEHDSAEHSVSAAPTPLRYTQVAIGLAALVCAVIQLIHGEAGDLYIGASLLGTAMTYYALRWNVLAFAPLSALTLVGCGLSNFLLPLVLTTFEAKPVTFELQRPDLTFGFNLLAFAVLIFVHFVYLQSSWIQAIRSTISLRLWRPLGIFVVPSPPQLFALGAVGLASMAYIYFFLGLTTGETFGSMGLKSLESLFWLAYAPYLLLLYPLLGTDWRPARLSVAPLLAYSVSMLVLGSARNSRAAIIVGATGVLIGVVLAGWLGLVPAKIFRPRNLFIASLAAVVALPVINHFGASMLLVRGDRYQASPIEVMFSTFGALFSDDSAMALAAYQAESAERAKWHGGDEYYLDSMLFGRLCNLKFADNTLSIVAGLDASGRSTIAGREWERALSILPQPILNALGVGLDKEAQRGSMGSFIYYISSGRPEILDQFATGSYLASGYATFGWFFPCIVGIIGLALFVGLDSFSTPAYLTGRPSISPVAAMGLFGISTLFTSAAGAPESVAGLFEVIVREIPQQTLVYVLTFWCVRQVLRL